MVTDLGSKLSNTRKKALCSHAADLTYLVWANGERQRANGHGGPCVEKKKGGFPITRMIGNEQEAISPGKNGEIETLVMIDFLLEKNRTVLVGPENVMTLGRVKSSEVLRMRWY
ncbi:hypothetical protein ACLOJK_039684 [Asimina triloba]